MINWLCTEAEDQLRRHVTVADNLTGVEQQQLEFTRFQSSADVSHACVVRGPVVIIVDVYTLLERTVINSHDE